VYTDVTTSTNQGYNTGKTYDYKKVRSWDDFGMDNTTKTMKVSAKDKKITLYIKSHYCIDLESKTYFNVDSCEEVSFRVRNGTTSTKPVENFVNEVAMDVCATPKVTYKNDINVFTEGFWGGWGSTNGTIICPEAIANKKKAQEEKRIAKELEEEKKKQEAFLASINNKRSLCTSIGFENETEGMKNCILQLMLEENNKAVVVAGGSSNDALTNAMRQQNKIMAQQLRLQKIENTQKVLKQADYMMRYGKAPPLGYGY